ncbi:hypothetical protein [Maricaulis salignorans]|uniref:Uncharacterized protein n=1 Tax=Maricaulis salignorans TaxID=144026 RepID=A0A1G9S2H5_9PROT|nr:hypothetical protein [Maricaulis salignorans]SDM29758.1 hypothetical protein SAMN04488568_10888 [Maricaulis salignorans]
MKKLLLATAAAALAGTAAWALDDDNHRTHVRIAAAPAMGGGQSATVIEIRGEDGTRTIHIQGDSPHSRLTVNGQSIVIGDDGVMIDGQLVETDGAGLIIVDGEQIQVMNDGDFNRFDGQFERHMSERAEALAHMSQGRHEFRFDFDSEGVETEVIASLEAALAGLESERAMAGNSRDWDALSEAEREEVRASIEEARQEIREAMREMRVEMREARELGDSESRRVRVEMRHAAREAAHAERDAAHAHRDAARAARDEARSERDQAREEARQEARVLREQRRHVGRVATHGGEENRSIRVERTDDGRRQVWVNGEEQTGDDLISWLNQLEAERLAGGMDGEPRRQERRIVRFDREDGSSREVDLTGRRVIVLRGGEADEGERVFEFEFDDRDEDDGK